MDGWFVLTEIVFQLRYSCVADKVLDVFMEVLIFVGMKAKFFLVVEYAHSAGIFRMLVECARCLDSPRIVDARLMFFPE